MLCIFKAVSPAAPHSSVRSQLREDAMDLVGCVSAAAFDNTHLASTGTEEGGGNKNYNLEG